MWRVCRLWLWRGLHGRSSEGHRARRGTCKGRRGARGSSGATFARGEGPKAHAPLLNTLFPHQHGARDQRHRTQHGLQLQQRGNAFDTARRICPRMQCVRVGLPRSEAVPSKLSRSCANDASKRLAPPRTLTDCPRVSDVDTAALPPREGRRDWGLEPRTISLAPAARCRARTRVFRAVVAPSPIATSTGIVDCKSIANEEVTGGQVGKRPT